MIFEQTEFHNVEELIPAEGGYKMSRLPKSVAGKLDERIWNQTSFFCCGVELRFVMLHGEVTLHLRVDQEEEAQAALIYFGNFQGGWQYSSRTIGTEDTAIRVRYPDSLDKLKEIAKTEGMPFSPAVVRILLPYGTCYYLGKEGETRPPLPEETPEKSYLAYGSSITHGSLGLYPNYTYSFLIAQRAGMDYVNQGYAGTAFVQSAMAEYLTQRRDWAFASVELGVNLVGKPISDEEFDDRVKGFLDILREDGRPVFVTDIFTNNGADQERTELFRRIVKRHAAGERLIYTPGNELMSCRGYVSADMTHPSGEGQRQIADNWGTVMEQYLRESVVIRER